MNFAPMFHSIATAGSERLLYSAVGGTLLAVAVWIVLQLFPRRDSRTNFAVWFSTLVATAVLPMLNYHSASQSTGTAHAVFMVSASWARYTFLLWTTVAAAGLLRVVVATIQVRRLRNQSEPLDVKSLPADLQLVIAEAQKARAVSLLVSKSLEVPTAIGFYKPAVILPAWLLESTPVEELKYILLHELAHLRRRDDWTNLAQKVLKALLFFLPSVWWIERRLALDREMACDDAVLAHSGSPRGYAECLARVAERSFLRRQLALAQAAVGRVRQLTARVTMILDPNRPRTMHSWKPAVPAVIVLAGLCALPASFTPELVSFTDGSPVAQQSLSSSGHFLHVAGADAAAKQGRSDIRGVRVIPASLRTDSGKLVPFKVKQTPSHRKTKLYRTTLARNALTPSVTLTAALVPRESEKKQYVTVREEVFFVVTERTPSGEQQSWQMHVWKVSLQPIAKPTAKPRKI